MEFILRRRKRLRTSHQASGSRRIGGSTREPLQFFRNPEVIMKSSLPAWYHPKLVLFTSLLCRWPLKRALRRRTIKVTFMPLTAIFQRPWTENVDTKMLKEKNEVFFQAMKKSENPWTENVDTILVLLRSLRRTCDSPSPTAPALSWESSATVFFMGWTQNDTILNPKCWHNSRKFGGSQLVI